jgi:hypothetical protein
VTANARFFYEDATVYRVRLWILVSVCVFVSLTRLSYAAIDAPGFASRTRAYMALSYSQLSPFMLVNRVQVLDPDPCGTPAGNPPAA